MSQLPKGEKKKRQEREKKKKKRVASPIFSQRNMGVVG